MQLAVIPPAEWPGLLSEWQQLLETAAEPTIFLAPGWITSWWRFFGGNSQPCLVTARDGSGRLLALAPLYRQRVSGLPFLEGTLHLMSDQGVGSEYLGVLCVPGYEQEFLNSLFGHLRGKWTVADLHGLREDWTVSRWLTERLAHGHGRLYREQEACSSLLLPNDYEIYLASLEPKFRTNVRYRTNKLIKNFRVNLIRTTRREEIAPHLQRLFAMHQARWQAQGLPGSFHSAQKRAFYHQVAADFLQRGWLRFYHLEVEGTIEASQFGFAFNNVLYSLQEAFDHQFRPPGVGGVGVVLRAMVIRECISEGVAEYDFLGGAEEFKSRWGTHTHYVQRIRIGAPGVRGAIAFAQIVGPSRLRTVIKQKMPDWMLNAITSLRSWRLRRYLDGMEKGS